MDAVASPQIVEQVTHRVAFDPCGGRQFGKQQRRGDPILVAHRVAHRVAERLLVAEDEPPGPVGQARPDDPFEPGQGFGVVDAVVGGYPDQHPRRNHGGDHQPVPARSPRQDMLGQKSPDLVAGQDPP